MPNIKSAEKRVDVIAKKTLENKSNNSRMKTALKKFNAAVDAHDVKTAESLLNDTISIIDRSATLGVMHKKKANRMKAQIYNRLNAAKNYVAPVVEEKPKNVAPAKAETVEQKTETVKKVATKKAEPKTAAAKKPAAKKETAEKAEKKPAAKKETAAKKPAVKKEATEKAEKKPAAKKTVEK